MSALDNLNKRLNYNGGNQENRMINDKLKSLKKSLLYSYQAATAVLADGREFRCLINPDKLKQDYEDKIISIPFKDICLNKPKEDKKTTEAEEEIGMQVGDVFQWKETDTYWLVYLQRLEEDAYFRAEIRKADYELDINGKKYRVYAHGPSATSILWHTKHNTISWNELNYDLILYITKNEDTEDFFHRFNKIKFEGKPWEVQVVDTISTEGIIEVALKETFSNTLQDEAIKEQKEKEEKAKQAEENKEETAEEILSNVTPEDRPYIKGDTEVYPYDTKRYSIVNAANGIWELSNNKAIIKRVSDTLVEIDIVTGRSGSVDLIYKRDYEEDVVLHIAIKSL